MRKCGSLMCVTRWLSCMCGCNYVRFAFGNVNEWKGKQLNYLNKEEQNNLSLG